MTITGGKVDRESCPFCKCHFPLDRNLCPNLECAAYRIGNSDHSVDLEDRKDCTLELINKANMIRSFLGEI